MAQWFCVSLGWLRDGAGTAAGVRTRQGRIITRTVARTPVFSGANDFENGCPMTQCLPLEVTQYV